MSFDQQSRFRQFSTRSLLMATAIIAVLMLGSSIAYRTWINQPDTGAVVRFLVQSKQPKVATKFLESVESSLQAQMIKDAPTVGVKAFEKSENRSAWLRQRLIVDTIISSNQDAILSVRFNLHSRDVTVTEADKLLRFASDIVVKDAKKLKISIDVLMIDVNKF